MQIARNLARSFENGIVFYSTVFNNKALKVFYDENDTIKMENVTDEYEATVVKDKNYKETKKRYMKQAGVLSVILICLAIALTQNVHWVLAAIFFSLYTSYDVIAFYHMVNHVRKKDEKGRTIARFLAAKQKVLNAYAKKDNSIPNTEEVKKASPFSKDCEVQSTIRTLVHTIIFTGILCLSALNAWLYLGVAVIYLILYALETKFSYLRVLQFFFMQEPTDKEIALAIEGLRELEIMENEFSENFGDGGIVVSFGDDGGFVMTMAIHFGSEEPGEDGETVVIKEHIEISGEEDSES